MSSQQQWYVIVEGEEGRRQEGPVSGADLEAMLSSGTISTDTLVWHDGMADWVQLGTVSDPVRPPLEETSAEDQDMTTGEPAAIGPSGDAPGDVGPADPVTIREIGNHSIQFSKSRNVLLVVTNDYHAEPLALTKLDLLGFLTAMEASS